jgi:hypothetical protein
VSEFVSCQAGCAPNCTLGLDLCVGLKVGVDVIAATNKTVGASTTTAEAYVYCACKKSSLA